MHPRLDGYTLNAGPMAINPSSSLISVVRRAQYLASMKVSDDVVRKENVDRDKYASVHTLVSA